MSKHVEMIIDYIVDGDDFQYNDNHGLLIRCKDCKYLGEFAHYILHEKDKVERYYCKIYSGYFVDLYDYCSKGVRNE